MIESELLKLLTTDSLRDRVCRLCLKEIRSGNNVSSYNIYKPDLVGYVSIQHLLEVIMANKLFHVDGYPEVICKECLDKAITLLEFKLKCEESNVILKKSLNMFHNEKEITNDFNNDDSKDFLMPFHFGTGTNELEEVFECKMCHETFSKKNDLEKHIEATSHSLQCRICETLSENRKRLKKHYKIHKNKKEFCCPYCEGYIKNKIHCDNFEYICHYCDFKFPCKYFLKQHISYEHADGIVCKKFGINVNGFKDFQKDFPVAKHCNKCGRIFKSAGHLNTHVIAMNCKYVCDYCKIEYKIKDQLKLHIMSKHTNYKPYKCDICQKSFPLKSMLKSHTVVHTKDRKFQCDFCGKKFVCGATLRYHRRIHTGERPYKCSTCSEGFLSMSRLREHEQVKHIGKVQCPICWNTFSRRSNLKKHMDKLHPNTYVTGQKYLFVEQTKEL